MRRVEPAPRLVRLRREAEAGQRPGDQRPRASWRSSARRATSSPVTTSRSASTAGGTTCAASRSTAACTRAEPGATSRPASRRRTSSQGYCEQHEMHHQLGLGRRRSRDAGACPTTRARRRRAGPSTSSSSGKPQFSQASGTAHRVATSRRGSASAGVLARSAWSAIGPPAGTPDRRLPGADRALDGGGAGDGRNRRARMTAPAVAARKGDEHPARDGDRVRRAVGAHRRRARAPT